MATIGSAAGTPDASTAADAPAATALAASAVSAVSAAASGSGAGAAQVPAAGVGSPSQQVVAAAIASTGGPQGGQELGPIVVPGSTRLRYDVAGLARGREVAARGEMLWLHDGSRYEARLEIGALFLGARVQTSHGQIGANGLEPTRFLDRARREQAVHFERDKGRISFSINSPPAPLLALSQDRLSVFIQLASMLAGDPARYPVGRTITLPTAGARDVEAWVFQVLGTERQTVLGEEADVVHLARVPRREFEPRLDLWMAPRVAWLPARIRLQQTNGDFIDQRLIAQEAP